MVATIDFVECDASQACCKASLADHHILMLALQHSTILLHEPVSRRCHPAKMTF